MSLNYLKVQPVPKESDLMLLVTGHSAYDHAWIASHARLIVDTSNTFTGIDGKHIFPA